MGWGMQPQVIEERYERLEKRLVALEGQVGLLADGLNELSDKLRGLLHALIQISPGAKNEEHDGG